MSHKRDTITFFDCQLVWWKSRLSWMFNLLCTPYTRLFCEFKGTSRVKSFSSCHTPFSAIRLTKNQTFQPMRQLFLFFSLSYPNSSWVSSNVWITSILFSWPFVLQSCGSYPCFSISRSDMWLPGLSPWSRLSPQQVLHSVVVVLGLPELGLLFIESSSLNLFKSLYTEILFFVGCSVQILLAFHPFSRKSFLMTAFSSSEKTMTCAKRCNRRVINV